MASALTPDLLATDARFAALASASERISALPLDGLLTYLIDTTPAHNLPELAQQFNLSALEGWDLALSDAQRRSLIQRSIALHRKKGTPWAVREALRLAGAVDSIEIEERLPVTRYDGSISHTGADRYSAHTWAQFRVAANLSDGRPIDAQGTARLIDAINEWKPVRSHLVDIQYRASAADMAPSSEVATAAAVLVGEDEHRWGRHRYDGSLAYNQGLLRTHEGAFAFGGEADYSGFTAAGTRFDSEREADDMAGLLQLTDVQSRGSLFDGFGDYGGWLDFGATAPVAQDPPIPITLTRHRRYDGRHAFAAHRHDGARAYAGGFTYFGNIPYAGDVITHLEA